MLEAFSTAVQRVVSPHYAPPVTKPQVAMFHAAIGMATEAGELLDNWKKAIFYGGRVFDTVNADEEVGDLLWYVMLYCNARGEQEGRSGAEHFAMLMQANERKLKLRYPERFETHQAENRNTTAEVAAVAQTMGNQ